MAILRLLKKKPTLTTIQLADYIGITERGIEKTK